MVKRGGAEKKGKGVFDKLIKLTVKYLSLQITNLKIVKKIFQNIILKKH